MEIHMHKQRFMAVLNHAAKELSAQDYIALLDELISDLQMMREGVDYDDLEEL